MTLPSNQSQQPPDVGSGGSEPTPPTPPAQYVTPDQLKQTLEVFGNQWNQNFIKAFGGIQSHTDKFMSKVDQQVNDLKAALEKQGVTVDEKMLETLKHNAMIDALADNPEGEQPPSQGLSDAEVISTAEALMRASGMMIYEGDPETAILDAAANGTPAQYFAAVQQACQAKIERTKGTQTPQPNQSNNPQQTTIAQNFSQVPGAVQGARGANPIANVTNFDELWTRVRDQGILPK